MTQKIVILGAGGFGREVLDIIDAVNSVTSDHGQPEYDVLGLLADTVPNERVLEPYGVSVLGPIADLKTMPTSVGYVIAIGNPQARSRIDAEFAASHPSPVLVHPTAAIGRRVDLGPGTVVASHVSLTNHINTGRHVHLNLNCTVGHDVFLADHVTLSPQVAISGNVRAYSRAFFGTGARVNPGLEVGADAIIGTGAAVIKPVPAGTTVVGVPAKPR